MAVRIIGQAGTHRGGTELGITRRWEASIVDFPHMPYTGLTLQATSNSALMLVSFGMMAGIESTLTGT